MIDAEEMRDLQEYLEEVLSIDIENRLREKVETFFKRNAINLTDRIEKTVMNRFGKIIRRSLNIEIRRKMGEAFKNIEKEYITRVFKQNIDEKLFEIAETRLKSNKETLDKVNTIHQNQDVLMRSIQELEKRMFGYSKLSPL